ncbi:MAG TPA: periplasmic heavy metal sensor [Pyrinomonadaceae bacterium]|nr:periplasmic heavy metal sensor [Pyrinomonadaceae bacterium]
MMRGINWRAFVLLLAVPLLTSFAQSDAAKPYAGQDARALKALSAEEIESYLKGQGMGLAKAAELNSYPGPRHVLELAAALKLSAQQRARTQQIFDAMHAEAVRLGGLIIEREKRLDALFVRREIDADKLRAATREIALLQGELRAAHLRAHLDMRSLLTPEQIKHYDQLRGYDSQTKTPPAAHRNHKH